MKLAIVGVSKIYTDDEERDIRQLIAGILYNEKPDLVISGGADGVDKLAIEVAKGLEYETKEYFPDSMTWPGYKVRNKRIANACDKLICISIPIHKKRCYHHKKGADETLEHFKKRITSHEKTAGCWTLNMARSLQKEVKFFMNRNNE